MRGPGGRSRLVATSGVTRKLPGRTSDEPRRTSMQLVNEFVVPRPVDQTWAVLTDVERTAPAMPAAQLTDHVDDQYHGKVKVKVGPVTAQYSGIAKFKELDAALFLNETEAT